MSKLSGGSADEKDLARMARERTMQEVYGRCLLLQVVSSCATINARPNLVLQHCNNDSAAAATMLGMMASSGGMLEFILNPLIGRLSDKYGRFIFIMLGPLGNCVLDGLIAANPSSPTLLVAGRVISGMTMTAFVTILRAAVSDVLEGSALAAAHSQSALYSGLGIIGGPWLASRLGTDRAAYGLSSVVAGLNGLYLLSSFQETLPADQRKEVATLNFSHTPSLNAHTPPTRPFTLHRSTGPHATPCRSRGSSPQARTTRWASSALPCGCRVWGSRASRSTSL
jgi:MFS family permease